LIATWAYYILYGIGFGMIFMCVLLGSIILRTFMDKRYLIEIIRIVKTKKIDGSVLKEAWVSEHYTISVTHFPENKIPIINKTLYKTDVKKFKLLGLIPITRRVDIYFDKKLFDVNIQMSELYRDKRAKKWALWYWFSNCRGKFLLVVNEDGEPYKYFKPKVPSSVIYNSRNSTVATEALNSEYNEKGNNARSIIIILVLILLIVIALVVFRSGGIGGLKFD